MFKSLIYKEWIKTRWFMAGYLLLGIIAVGLLFLDVQHDFKFSGANNIWNSILFQYYPYYSTFKFIPLVGGIILGISQYFPETVEKRIKLTYHLPVNENKILLQMMSYGSIILLSCFAILFLIFWTISSQYFPKEIVNDAIVSILPWFLAGFTSYYLIGLIVLEPIWRYRFLYIIVSAFFISIYLRQAINAAYQPMNAFLIVSTAVSSIVLIFSGYRFRKGEQ